MANPFDQFDAAPAPPAKRGNAFDRFDKVAAPAVRAVKPMHPEFDGSHIPGYNPDTGRVEKYGKAGSAAMGAADTMALGFGDEAAAGVITLIEKLRGEGKPYTEILKQVRGNQDDAYQDNPKSYIGGMVAGGVAGGGALARSGLSLGARALTRGAPLRRFAMGSAADGAILGGASGVGSGTDIMGNLLRGRPVSAVVSAITRGMNEAKGLPPSVLERVARALMETNPDTARGLLAAGANRNAATDGQRAVVNAIINDLGASSAGRLATP